MLQPDAWVFRTAKRNGLEENVLKVSWHIKQLTKREYLWSRIPHLPKVTLTVLIRSPFNTQIANKNCRFSSFLSDGTHGVIFHSDHIESGLLTTDGWTNFAKQGMQYAIPVSESPVTRPKSCFMNTMMWIHDETYSLALPVNPKFDALWSNSFGLRCREVGQGMPRD